jgi:hypothetical protein
MNNRKEGVITIDWTGEEDFRSLYRTYLDQVAFDRYVLTIDGEELPAKPIKNPIFEDMLKHCEV